MFLLVLAGFSALMSVAALVYSFVAKTQSATELSYIVEFASVALLGAAIVGIAASRRQPQRVHTKKVLIWLLAIAVALVLAPFVFASMAFLSLALPVGFLMFPFLWSWEYMEHARAEKKALREHEAEERERAAIRAHVATPAGHTP
jgi:chromate transport protein ChrA